MGGGHLGVNVFATGDCSRQNAEKLQKIGKNFRVPPPPVANTVTPKCPPPVACPVRHLTTHLTMNVIRSLSAQTELR